MHASSFAILGVPAVSLLLLGQVASCSSDDTTSSTTPDASEASTPDSTSPEDGGVRPEEDAADATPVEPDADSGTQMMAEPDADSGSVGEGGPAACSLTVPSQGAFLSALAGTVCQSLKTCCGTGAKFDTATCLSIYGNASFGGWMGTGFVAPYLDSGRIDYDTASACQCLESNATISCGLVSAATWNGIQKTCFAAIHGTSSAAADGGAASCGSSYECVTDQACSVENAADPSDAGLGQCQGLVGDGGGCTDDFQCSYLTNGDTGLHCDGTSHTCVPRVGDGVGCQVNENCLSNNCTSASCQSGVVFSDPVGSNGICDFFVLKDGG